MSIQVTQYKSGITVKTVVDGRASARHFSSFQRGAAMQHATEMSQKYGVPVQMTVVSR
jgi:hypothetical protein